MRQALASVGLDRPATEIDSTILELVRRYRAVRGDLDNVVQALNSPEGLAEVVSVLLSRGIELWGEEAVRKATDGKLTMHLRRLG